jgi:hypothetical protein
MAVEWLSNGGYNQAIIRTGREMGERLDLEWLKEAGDQIHNFKNLYGRRRQKVVLVDVMGMPGAGKDTLLTGIMSLRKKWIYCSGEPYSVLKDGGGSTRQDRLVWGTMGEMIAARVGLLRQGTKKGGLTILNRGFTDYQVMTRAKYSSGEVSEEQLKVEFKSGWVPDATVVLMLNKREAMKRIYMAGRTGRGGHSNLEFLDILHREYETEILKMMQEKRQNLVVMNMEGSKEGNLERFKKVLGRITGEEV